MKNIHILPTDKPSRLGLHNNGELELHSNSVTKNLPYYIPQNIYITSDEDVKKGIEQWYLDKFLNKLYNSGGAQYSSKQNVIILTTDQDLIKDGVQAIDDNFLEWFVNNPSCEFVQVIDDENITDDGMNIYSIYKIIIPKEELKQETSLVEKLQEISNLLGKMNTRHEKQETLEEAAHKMYPKRIVEDGYDLNAFSRYGFYNGAKWQQKRSYSEEDVKALLLKYWNEADGKNGIAMANWIKQNL